VFTAFISFKRGLDPDDMVAPVVTTVGDFMGIVFLFFILGIFGVGL
jgi:mgtE-like transporter